MYFRGNNCSLLLLLFPSSKNVPWCEIGLSRDGWVHWREVMGHIWGVSLRQVFAVHTPQVGYTAAHCCIDAASAAGGQTWRVDNTNYCHWPLSTVVNLLHQFKSIFCLVLINLVISCFFPTAESWAKVNVNPSFLQDPNRDKKFMIKWKIIESNRFVNLVNPDNPK